MVRKPCPHEDELASFVRCELSDVNVAIVLEHLDDCSQCEETVAKLEQTLRSVLPGAAATVVNMPFAEESGCHRTIQRLVTELTAFVPDSALGSETKPLTEPESPPELRTLRDFRIVEKVGQGGMGAVYKAVHQRMQRTVAMKVLPSGLIGDQSAVARFNREMSVLGQLNHPHIVQAFDAGDHDGQHYLAMEFIEGQDLATLLKRDRRLSISNASLVISQVASALQYAHEKGFVHRDIKPSNLMLAEIVGADGNLQAIVKLLDLGLARVFEQTTADHEQSSSELTSAGQIMGTLDYMAPEQGADSHLVDIRTDIYSLGATFYKFLTGETPFAEHAAKPPMQRLMAMATSDVPQVSSKRPDIPEKLAVIVHRMLEKDPARRFQTPMELLRVLEEFTSGANLLALMQRDTASVTDSKPSRASGTAQPLSASGYGVGKHGGRRALAIFGGIAVFMLLSAILVLTTRHGRIEVTSPDGTLPADLKVAVFNGGDSVEVLQAGNQWSAKVVNGEYQLQLTGGDDKFEIKESKLTVSRMGKTVVVVELRKADVLTAAKSNTLPGTSDARPKMSDGKDVAPTIKLKSHTDAPDVPVASDKPFWLVRQGKPYRNFSTLPGALGDLQAGDIIEILSNERLVIRTPEPITRPLHLRAGAGFRPLLDFSEHHSLEIQSDFTVEGCDLDWRNAPLRSSDHQGVWKILNCRHWGYFLASCKSISFENSILVGSHSCVTFSRSCTDATFDNCLIRYEGGFLATDSPQLHLKFNNCTFHVFGHGTAGLIHEWGPTLGADTQLTVEATGNVFNCTLAAGHLIPQSSQSKVHWIGNENLFSGRWYDEYKLDGDESKLAGSGLNAWNNWLKTPEKDSREVPELALEWGRVQNLDGLEFQQGVKEQVEQIKQREQLTDVDFNWDIIGPGDAYVRALAAAGKPVAEADLRPERLEAGAVILLHSGAEPRGFLTLIEALDAAVDQDVIEFRTDGPIPGTKWNGENRTLTIRAAPGYSPFVDGSLTNMGTDRLIVEGLILRHGLYASSSWMSYGNTGDGSNALYSSDGSFIRVANCQVLEETHLSGWFASGTDAVPEIVNCISPSLEVGLHAAGTVNIRNSVFKRLQANMETASASPGKVACDRCVFWRPLGGALQDYGHAVLSFTPVTFSMDHSLFAAKLPFLFHPLIPDHPPLWTGNHNTYICSQTTDGFRLKQALREKFNSDADSIELLPFEFDPAQWRILQDPTHGYEPKTDGTDFGARIDELTNAMK